MNPETLQHVLEELQAVLDDPKLSDESRATLKHVVGDLAPESDQSTRDRVKAAIMSAEVSHPKLAALLERLAETLSEIGV